ncbi:hypothetical protein UFOVP592_4 [uncultured Caudovirales phage]|uniref:Uncharacterized protein n=1 Tax=uncultured Caudovirales phage TaxID=2100421 RepID=A0A6J5MZ25_9CAUD|nr:hypothetical protein UFOVP592_4 [uncultured Caudovirales phage]
MTLSEYLQNAYTAPSKPVKMATAVGYWTDINGLRQVHFINSEKWFKKRMTEYMEGDLYCPDRTPWHIVYLTTPLPKRKLNKMTYLQLQDIAPDPGVVSLGCL